MSNQGKRAALFGAVVVAALVLGSSVPSYAASEPIGSESTLAAQETTTLAAGTEAPEFPQDPDMIPIDGSILPSGIPQTAEAQEEFLAWVAALVKKGGGDLGSLVSQCAAPTSTTQSVCAAVIPLSGAALKEARTSAAADAQQQAQARGSSAGLTVPIPQYCIDNFNSATALATRTSACRAYSFYVQVRRIVNGVDTLTGSVSGNIYSYQWMNATAGTVFHELAQKTVTIGGNGGSVMITGAATCGGNCDGSVAGFGPVQAVTNRQTAATLSTVPRNTASGTINPMSTNWKLTFAAPGSASAVINDGTFVARCDTVVTNRPTGCVIPAYYPIIGFSTSPNAKSYEVGMHIRDAQLSGITGGDRAHPLTRTGDQTLINKNRSRACGSVPAVTGKSCDEYPFASTKEGAMAYATSTARTFSWCSIANGGSASGPGYSRCMVAKDQNSSQGGSLGAFYSSLRVLSGDKFAVTTTQ